MRMIASSKKSTLLIVALSAALMTMGCSNMSRGGALGGLLGGGIGGLIGKRTGNTAAGVILGAAIGGAAGASIGRYMDKQADEMRRDLKGVKIERVGEGIKLTFASGILFGFDSDELTGQAASNVNQLAAILKKYDDTELMIQGYTDSVGSDDYNQKLSEKRAASVAETLADQGVTKKRLAVEGYGEQKAVASNSTDSGRAENRRVEIAITASKELQKAAKNNKDLDKV